MRLAPLTLRVAVYAVLAGLALSVAPVFAQNMTWPYIHVNWTGENATIIVSGVTVFKPNSTIINVYYVDNVTLRIVWECLVPPCAYAYVNVTCFAGSLAPPSPNATTTYNLTKTYSTVLGLKPHIDPSTRIAYDVFEVSPCPFNATVNITILGKTYHIIVYAPRIQAGRPPFPLVEYILAGIVMMLAFVRNRRHMAIGLIAFSVTAQVLLQVVQVKNPAMVYAASIMAGVFGAILLII